MKIIIQCAGRKRHNAGSLVADNGKQIVFVSEPQDAPHNSDAFYARPDDLSASGKSWRGKVLEYNNLEASQNPCRLLPAYQLYANPTYGFLVERYGINNIYILSAGWGLIPANFLTPMYDITFSPNAQPYCKRRKGQKYDDFCLMPDDGGEIVFLGGKDYLPLFCKLTKSYTGKKFVYYNSITKPNVPDGYETVLFKTSTRTNWHYECAVKVDFTHHAHKRIQSLG